MFYTFMTRVVRPILWLLFRPRVVGGENVPSYGPLIVASNHLSFIDSFIIPWRSRVRSPTSPRRTTSRAAG